MKILPEDAAPEMRWMMDYWITKRGDRQIPLRSDIDPLEFHKMWSTTYFLEGTTLEDLYVKVAGTAYWSLYGYEVTGQRIVDLIPGVSAPHVIADYVMCLENRVPVYREGRMTWREKNTPIAYARLLLPFGKTMQTVAYILGYAIVFSYDSKERIVF